MKRLIRYGFAAYVGFMTFVLYDCAPAETPSVVVEPDEDMDAGAYIARDASGDVCDRVAHVLRVCGCLEAESSSFPAWCRRMGAAIDVQCIASLRKCDRLVKCKVRCMQ